MENFFTIHAAVGCDNGLTRSGNEDNLYFNGKTLEEKHNGLRHPLRGRFPLDRTLCFSIFDGMGGEEAGETASFQAARTMQAGLREADEYLLSPSVLLRRLCTQMNEAVCKASSALEWGRMGCTAAALLFTGEEVYVCNLGDSRAYRLRDKQLLQLTVDHSEAMPANARGKAPLVQFLGIPPEELRLEPHIGKGALASGDRYLICSDGLTDMLSPVEICTVMKEVEDVQSGVERLISLALAHGGKDNVTVILCEVE